MGGPREADTIRPAARMAWAGLMGFTLRCRNAGTSLDPRAGQSATGAREPSEDTVKRATFARM